MIKKLKLFVVALGFLALVSCNNNERNEQANVEEREIEVQEDTPEEKDVELNVDADNKEIGVETEDVNIDLKGEDDDNKDNKN